MRCHRNGISAVVRLLLQAFLHLVLAEIPLASRVRLAHAIGRERLRDGHQRDVRRRPSGPPRGVRDAAAHFGEILCNRHVALSLEP